MTTADPSDRRFADRDDRRYAGTAVQKASLIAGIVFLVVGIRRTMKVARQERELAVANEPEPAGTSPPEGDAITPVDHIARKED